MRPVNIYALTRITDGDRISRLERQMSGRGRHLKIKEWEIDGLRRFSDGLCKGMPDAARMEFFYSFTMPKLGKEFDLLRIGNDLVVNIELKSGDVTDAAIKRQLEQNRYYLSTLGYSIYSYTYISENDRLVRLSGGGRLVETDWAELSQILDKQKDCYTGDVEELFKEDKYLISPLTDPDRFLRGDYFLTSQQRDIRGQILKDVLSKPGSVRKSFSVHGFTGLPGTGKTILLYDIAMQLSVSERVCVLHLGSHEEELKRLDDRLKRVDFLYLDPSDRIELDESYSAILVDEGHRLGSLNLADILVIARGRSLPVIISYDREDTIAEAERGRDGAFLIENIEGFKGYRLTNRIRLNSELSSFISSVMCITRGSHRYDYPSVSLLYANDAHEAAVLTDTFVSEGYRFIWDSSHDTSVIDILTNSGNITGDDQDYIEARSATCREFDGVVMLIDDSFRYDETGYLRSVNAVEGSDSVVRNLFHGLNRAKKRIALIVMNNESVFDRILGILQRRDRK